jgi:hypothetical protein
MPTVATSVSGCSIREDVMAARRENTCQNPPWAIEGQAGPRESIDSSGPCRHREARTSATLAMPPEVPSHPTIQHGLSARAGIATYGTWELGQAEARLPRSRDLLSHSRPERTAPRSERQFYPRVASWRSRRSVQCRNPPQAMPAQAVMPVHDASFWRAHPTPQADGASTDSGCPPGDPASGILAAITGAARSRLARTHQAWLHWQQLCGACRFAIARPSDVVPYHVVPARRPRSQCRNTYTTLSELDW